MKKIVMILLAVIGFGFSVNAQTARITRTTPEKNGIRVYFKISGIYQDRMYNTSGKYTGKDVESVTVKICAQSDFITRLVNTTCDYKEYTPPSNPSYTASESSILFTCDTSQLNRCGISDFKITIDNVTTR